MRSNAILQKDFIPSNFDELFGKKALFLFICTRIYPTQQTYSDQAFLARVQTLEWIDFDFLEIPEKNRCPEMWEYAAKST